MIKSTMIFGIIIFLIYGCAPAHLSLDQSIVEFTRDQPIKGEIILIHKSVNNVLFIDDYQVMDKDGKTIVQIKIGNKTHNEVSFEYKVQLYSGGIKLDHTSENWIPKMINQNDYTFITIAMPVNNINKFELYLKKGGDYEM